MPYLQYDTQTQPDEEPALRYIYPTRYRKRLMKRVAEICANIEWDGFGNDEDFEYQEPSGWGALLKEIQCEAVIRRGRIVSFADGSSYVIGDIESIYVEHRTGMGHTLIKPKKRLVIRGQADKVGDFLADIEEKGSQVARMAMSNQYE